MIYQTDAPPALEGVTGGAGVSGTDQGATQLQSVDLQPPAVKLSMHVSLFSSLGATQCDRRDIGWPDLCSYLVNPPEFQTKAACPLLKLGAFGDQLSKKGSLRHDANLLFISGVEGDHDAGVISPQDAAALMRQAGVAGIIYTTPSHTAAAPRWRVLAPVSQNYQPAIRRELTARLNHVFAGTLATESFTLSQAYYFGRVAGAPYEAYVSDGQCLDLLALPAIYPTENPNANDGDFALSDAPVPEWNGPTDDDELLRRMLKSHSARSALAGGASPMDLWTANVEVLARTYPDGNGRPYDASRADAALASILAFWTGRHGERIERLMHQSALAREKWQDRDDYLARTIANACRLSREVLQDKPPAPPVTFVGGWTCPPPIDPLELEGARATPACIVNGLFFADVGQMIAAGGTGKTTVMIYQAVHIVLGRPLYGLEIHKPGPVLILTAEDSREMLVARLRAIGRAMALSDVDWRIVMERVRISDVSGTGMRLTEVVADVVIPAASVDDLIAGCQALQPVLIVIDPAVSFGVGEARVNDAEQGLIDAARRLRNALKCGVVYIHHTGKANARDGAVDQYAGRGGSALADGSRMVHVLRPLTASEWRTATGEDLQPGESGLMLARPKMSYSPPQDPIFIARNGYAFRTADAKSASPDAERAEQADRVLAVLRAEVAAGHFPTRNSLEGSETGLSRAQLRTALARLDALGLIEDARRPASPGGHGAHKFIRPSASPVLTGEPAQIGG